MMNLLVAQTNEINAAGVASLIRGTITSWKTTYVVTQNDLKTHLAFHPCSILLISQEMLGGRSDGLAELCRLHPKLKVVVLLDTGTSEVVLRCLAHGALGCILASASPGDLVSGLQAVADGRLHIPLTVDKLRPPRPPASAMPDHDADRGMSTEASPGDKPLTPRQRQVLHLLQQGQSTKQIARVLHLAVPTVKVYLTQTYRALGARNRFEAVMHAGTPA